MMRDSLQSLFTAIAQAQNLTEVHQRVMVTVSEYFAARRCRLFFFDELSSVDPKWQGLLKFATSVEYNPVLRYLVEHHAPVHEALVVSPKAWRAICPRADHWHVMTGPVVCHSQLVGGIGLTRERGNLAFTTQDLTDLGAICLHLSTRIATMRSPSVSISDRHLEIDRSKSSADNSLRLTPREIQIADLVAQGLTNAEIGAQLWITENSVKQALKRIFRKLNVSSRAQMVAQLQNVLFRAF
ncbi:helix-turn-helix transcriptional regulator [Scytonema millei]|nr:LuxR C-terminal-related transcriptional regulator [Scytonema millei]